ncbi:hypothetical protein HMPREF1120_08519 [Lecanosticta acicola]|uniref:Uncharacterized protein n=1 Tax=Lecanosticta acicola TaxID=111012 RepID=A0AAI8YSC3_9PEZI|nr:hypothetical protein HMPREF1120_08519 [Lecanosticta acicola]
MPLIARRFSITNFLIATSALGFQVFVLYPWHNRLDEDFKALREENLRLMRRFEGTLGGGGGGAGGVKEDVVVVGKKKEDSAR